MHARSQVLVCAGLFSIGGLFAPLVLQAQERNAARTRCSNNLRQLGLAMVQYGDDKRFLPHVGPTRELDGGFESGDSPRHVRALVWFGYHDNPAGFVCPESDDYALPITDEEVFDNMRLWAWEGARGHNTTPPWFQGDAPALSGLRELSYATTRRGYNRNVSSVKLLAADRAMRDGVARGPKEVAGNHDDGWNVLQADATVSFVTHGDELAALLPAQEGGGGFLAVRDQRDGAGFKPLSPEPPPAPHWSSFYAGESGSVRIDVRGWDRRSRTWGLQGELTRSDGQKAAFYARASEGGPLKGVVLVGPKAVDMSASATLKQLELEVEGKRMSFNLEAAPLDDQTRELVSVGFIASLRSGNVAAARAFLTAAGLKRLEAKTPLATYVAELAAAPMESLGPMVPKFAREVVRDADGVARVDFGRAPEPGAKPRAAGKAAFEEAAAIGALKTIATAQTLFREADKDRNGVLDYAADLRALGACDLVDSVLASGDKSGYRFEVCRGGDESSAQFVWMATASPKQADSGQRHFAVNHAGMIYTSDKPFALNAACELKGGEVLRR